ncbi:MAG: S-adenosylmethionine decarboxylase [Candidatus Magasanikbacteria bacterium]
MFTKRYHYIFDIDHCHEKNIRNRKLIPKFLRETVTTIGMKILMGPYIRQGVPENPGITGIAVLDFSHMSVHTFTKTNEVLIDVFSCKPYEKKMVRDICIKYFGTPKSKVREKKVWWG